MTKYIIAVNTICLLFTVFILEVNFESQKHIHISIQSVISALKPSTRVIM